MFRACISTSEAYDQAIRNTVKKFICNDVRLLDYGYIVYRIWYNLSLLLLGTILENVQKVEVSIMACQQRQDLMTS